MLSCFLSLPFSCKNKDHLLPNYSTTSQSGDILTMPSSYLANCPVMSFFLIQGLVQDHALCLLGCHTSLLSFNRDQFLSPFLQCHWHFWRGQAMCFVEVGSILSLSVSSWLQSASLLIRIRSLIFGRISTSVLLDPSQSTTSGGCDTGSSHYWWSRNCRPRTFPAVQWLRLPLPIHGGTGLIPGRRTKNPHATQCGQNPPPKPKLQSFLFFLCN